MDWSVEHVLTVEDRLGKAVVNDYQVALENSWWDRCMMERPGGGRKEILEFLLTTADIHLLEDGEQKYDELVTQFFEFTHETRGTGLKVTRDQFEDDELQKAQEWAGQVGAAMALAPQYQAVSLILSGETALGYDDKPFFAEDHPVNPFDTSKGDYANLLGSLALADTDGHPILKNFNAAEAAIRSFKMPNGRNRNLQPTFLMVPPSLKGAAIELTGARVILATENVFQSDFKANFNGKSHTGVEVIVVNELEDDSNSDWYLGCNAAGTNMMPLMYSNRRPYTMNSYNGLTQVELGRLRFLEWLVDGRNVAFFGHPYQLIKVKAAAL